VLRGRPRTAQDQTLLLFERFWWGEDSLGFLVGSPETWAEQILQPARLKFAWISLRSARGLQDDIVEERGISLAEIIKDADEDNIHAPICVDLQQSYRYLIHFSISLNVAVPDLPINS
jgi:hypothetical protein